MPSCINNCYNLESFWKTWHASFNKWLVRYMFSMLFFILRSRTYTMIIFLRMSIGTCTFPLGDLGGSFWMCGLSSHLLPYGMILNGTFYSVPINFISLFSGFHIWISINFTGNFFHGHGWHAYSLFRKCLWNQQQLLLRWSYACWVFIKIIFGILLILK